jgi:hypothetical protein
MDWVEQNRKVFQTIGEKAQGSILPNIDLRGPMVVQD